MKPFHLIPLLFLTACSTTPRLTLQPQPPPTAADNSAVRYPEIIRVYHVGRYADPNDDLVMHEQHVVYRVEENTRWDFRPGAICGDAFQTSSTPRDVAFSPAPVNDAILAEVNDQRLATAKIMVQARSLSAALAQVQSTLLETKTNLQATVAMRATLGNLKKRLDALEAAQEQSPESFPAPMTNEPPDSFSP